MLVEQLRKVRIEHHQQQTTDVSTVIVGISRNDNLIKAEILFLIIFIELQSDNLDYLVYLSVSHCFRCFDIKTVQTQTSHTECCLVTSICTSDTECATGRQSLEQIKFAAFSA